MGRVLREAHQYYTKPQYPTRARFLEPINGYYPELNQTKFPIIQLPPKWAVYFDEYPGTYFPICTWGDCNTKELFTRSGETIFGNILASTALVKIEQAEWFLDYHLTHMHNLRNVVEPFKPYGQIFLKEPTRVWK